MGKQLIHDALYGRLDFDEDMLALISAPLVQRLRHVRLSNIDSIASPGIANISRFEHVLGVANLVAKLPFFAQLSKYDRLVVQASALLHDWAITAFGHLVEEAYAYAGAKFDHEGKLHELVMGDGGDDVGGVERQILGGRETGLKKWAVSCVGTKKADSLIYDITQTIVGGGQFGKLIAGSMDVDNVDNVFRVAYHLGLAFDKALPGRIVGSMCRIDTKSGEPIFNNDSAQLILAWVEMRERVYDHLMLAEPDFTSKMMLICAVVIAYREQEIANADWNLTDHELITRLRGSKNRECRDIVDRWLVGEYWDSSNLVWMRGDRPTFVQLNKFNEEVSKELGRKIFSYCIKDKRKRLLSITFEDDSNAVYGENSTQWLLGVGSPTRRAFTLLEESQFVNCAEKFFNTPCNAKANVSIDEDGGASAQSSLI